MLPYDKPLSSYCQKVKIALHEKDISFEKVLPDDFATGRRDMPFAIANPRREVPALVDGDIAVFESTSILEYIEDRWPEPALLPSDPAAARAQARIIEDVCDTQYEAANWGYGEVAWFKRAEGDLAERLKAAAVQEVVRLQAWLDSQLGGRSWSGGDQFSWADVAAAPLVNRSAFHGFGPADGTPLAAWLKRVRERPSVSEAFAPFDEAANRIGSAAGMSRSAGRRREYRLERMIRSGGIEVVLAGMNDDSIRFSWAGETAGE